MSKRGSACHPFPFRRVPGKESEQSAHNMFNRHAPRRLPTTLRETELSAIARLLGKS